MKENLAWVQQCLFLVLVQLVTDVIIQVVTVVIEKQYKLTSLYVIRTPIQLKEIQRIAYTYNLFCLRERKL